MNRHEHPTTSDDDAPACDDLRLARRLRALLRLFEAHAPSDSQESPAPACATTVAILRDRAGIDDEDVRWLLTGWACELPDAIRGTPTPTPPSRTPRSKRNGSHLSDGLTLAITDAGAAFVSQVLVDASPRCGQPLMGAGTSSPADPAMLLPDWCEATGELRLGRTVVKRLSARAWAQRRILAAFQSASWQFEIASPCAQLPAAQRDKYLRRLLSHLNQPRQAFDRALPRIHFSSVAKGRQVRWSIVLP